MRQTSPRGNLAIGYGGADNSMIESPDKTISEAAFSIGADLPVQKQHPRQVDRQVTEPNIHREEMSPQGGGFFMTQSDQFNEKDGG